MEKKENMETVEIIEEQKALDFTELENRLDELDSNAFIHAERACRMVGDPTPDIVYSANFRARLAATAMGVPFEEIRKLKLRTYTAVITRTLNFLLQSLGEELTRRSS